MKKNKFLEFLSNNKFTFILLGSFIIFISVYFAVTIPSMNKTPHVEVQPNNTYSETLRVATDNDYRPYSYFDSNNNPSGYDIELMNYIANTVQKNLTLEMLSWNDANEKLKNNEVDILMTCDINDNFLFEPQPYKTLITSIDEYVVFSKQPIKDISSFLDGGVRAGYMKNGNAEETLEKLGLLDKCVPYPTNKEMFDAVERDELEAAVIRNNIGVTLLRDLNYSDIVPRYSIAPSYMCFVVNASKPSLIVEINAAIRKLSDQGILEKLKDKWLTTFVKPYSFGDVFVQQIWIIPLLALIVLLIILSQFYNTRRVNQLNVIKTLSTDFELVIYVHIRSSSETTYSVYKTNKMYETIQKELKDKRNFKEYVHKFCEEIVYEEDQKSFLAHANKEFFFEELKNKDTYFFNFRGKTNNTVEYFQLKFSAIRDKNGKVVNAITGLHNVDAETRKIIQQNNELKESRLAAESSSRAKTEFLFNMSHDIRTPMNAILGYANNAKRHVDDKEHILGYLNNIEKAGNSLSDLLNEILEMSRIESGKYDLDYEDYSLTDDLNNLISIFSSSLQNKNITFDYDLFQIGECYVRADRVKINRILSNVIGNAIKYTNNDGCINFVTKREHLPEIDNFTFIIQDNGIGMSEDFQKVIFDAFSREHNFTTSKIQGFGLGMSIVKKLVDLLKGTIEIESKINVGTKVTIKLPLELSDESKCDLGGENDQIDSIQNIKILLVDDNSMNREIAKEMLEDQGAIIKTADDGDVAVDIIKNSAPGDFDLILMDV